MVYDFIKRSLKKNTWFYLIAFIHYIFYFEIVSERYMDITRLV